MNTENEKQTSVVLTVTIILAVVLGINYFVTSVLLSGSSFNLYKFWLNFFGGGFGYTMASMVIVIISAIGVSALYIVSAIKKNKGD